MRCFFISLDLRFSAHANVSPSPDSPYPKIIKKKKKTKLQKTHCKKCPYIAPSLSLLHPRYTYSHMFAQTERQTHSELVLVVASCPRSVHLSAQFEKAIWLQLPLRQIQQPRCKIQPKMQATGPLTLPTLHCQFVCALKLLPNSGPKWPNSCNKIFRQPCASQG